MAAFFRFWSRACEASSLGQRLNSSECAKGAVEKRHCRANLHFHPLERESSFSSSENAARVRQPIFSAAKGLIAVVALPLFGPLRRLLLRMSLLEWE